MTVSGGAVEAVRPVPPGVPVLPSCLVARPVNCPWVAFDRCVYVEGNSTVYFFVQRLALVLLGRQAPRCARGEPAPVSLRACLSSRLLLCMAVCHRVLCWPGCAHNVPFLMHAFSAAGGAWQQACRARPFVLSHRATRGGGGASCHRDRRGVPGSDVGTPSGTPGSWCLHQGLRKVDVRSVTVRGQGAHITHACTHLCLVAASALPCCWDTAFRRVWTVACVLQPALECTASVGSRLQGKVTRFQAGLLPFQDGWGTCMYTVLSTVPSKHACVQAGCVHNIGCLEMWAASHHVELLLWQLLQHVGCCAH